MELVRTRHRPIPDLVDEVGNWTKTNENWGTNPSHPDAKMVSQTKLSGKFSFPSFLKSQQTTVDENHSYSARSLRGEFRGDIGGPFSSTKVWVATGNSDGSTKVGPQSIYSPAVWLGHWDREHYSGSVLACSPTLDVFPTDSARNLAPIGTTAIARCKPTNNVSDLAVDLAELYRDGLPNLFGSTLWKKRTQAAKAAGGEYLNTEFGWKPLADDIRSASYAVANSHRLLKAYEENSGKVVRRSYEFPIEQSETSQDLGTSDGFTFTAMNPWVLDASKFPPHLIKTTKFYRRTWFSGAFTYHLPTGYNSRNEIVRAAARAGPLLGIELTPEVVWAAVPWTWAFNWFSNMGDVVKNLSDWQVDGLVLKWGYIMEHTLRSVTYTLDRRTRYMAEYPIASPVTYFFERKRRVKATPFGFELNWPQFTPRQLAITVALGLLHL